MRNAKDHTKIRWGVLGTGNIAGQFCDGLTTCNRGVPIAVGSRAASRALEFGTRFGFLRTYADYRQVLGDPDVDAVYISLPNSMHCEWTLNALRAGKHVLCEKPIAANESEAKSMFAAARRARRVLVEAFMYRSHPLTREVLRKVHDSAIGEIKIVRTSFCYKTSRIDGNVRFRASLAGGALMDVGCYCIDFSRMVVGADPIEVNGTAVMHESGVDELAVGTLKFPNGTLASFTCGMTVHSDNTAYICGSEGFVEIPWPWKPQPRGTRYLIKANTPPRQDGGQPVRPPAEEFVVETGINIFALEADDFASTVLDGKPPMMTEDASVGNMRVLDEMRRKFNMLL